MKEVTDIKSILSGLFCDLRGEVIIAQLLENDFIDDNWVISLDGTFKRGYAKDMQALETLQLEGQELLNFHLSRDGFYDSLPEGLFHPVSDKPTENGHELAIESKKERKRENDIRKFFAPFEQESFNLKLQIEKKERIVLTKLIQGQMSDFFTQFWKTDNSLNKKLTKKMIAYIPFVQRIVGNFDLTFSLLEVIIEEKVSYKVVRTRNSDEFINNDDKSSGLALGEASLSWNFVCGSHTLDLTPLIEITLGPIIYSEVHDYFEGGNMRNFIDYFCSFFLPLDIDYALKFETNNTKDFMLVESGKELIMGFETHI